MKQPHRLAADVEHLPHPDVRVVDGQLRPLLEGQPVQPGGGEEHAVLEHVVHLEVRPELRCVEGVAFRPHLLGVVRPVPGGQRQVGAFRRRHRLQVGRLALRVGHRGRGEAGEPLVDGVHRPGRLPLEDVGGVVGVAEHGGALGPQPGHLGDDPAVVVLAALAAAGERGPHDALAEAAVLERRQGRLPARVQQRDDVAAFQVARLRRRDGGRDLALGEPRQLVARLDHHGRGVHLVEHVLGEPARQRRQPGVDGLHALLLGVGEPRPGPHEVDVVLLDEPPRLVVEAERVALLVQRLDPREQAGVEQHAVGVGGQTGRHLVANRVDGVVGVGAGEREERRRDAVQQLARPFEGHDGVLERRRLRGPGNRLDLGDLVGHAPLERRRVVRVVDAVERRKPMGQRALGEERVVGHLFLCGCGRGISDGDRQREYRRRRPRELRCHDGILPAGSFVQT